MAYRCVCCGNRNASPEDGHCPTCAACQCDCRAEEEAAEEEGWDDDEDPWEGREPAEDHPDW